MAAMAAGGGSRRGDSVGCDMGFLGRGGRPYFRNVVAARCGLHDIGLGSGLRFS